MNPEAGIDPTRWESAAIAGMAPTAWVSRTAAAAAAAAERGILMLALIGARRVARRDERRFRAVAEDATIRHITVLIIMLNEALVEKSS
jgi:hypothetical protein